MLTIKIVGKDQLYARFAAMPEKLHKALLARIHGLSQELKGHVVRDKLQGQVLNKITGRLAGSIQNEVIDHGNSIIGRVYSSTAVNYAAVHEYGGRIPDRYPVNAKALHFKIGGKEVFCKFARGFTMPERSFLRSSLEDYRQKIIDGMTKAAKKAVQNA